VLIPARNKIIIANNM